jgi:diphthine-ammonia ligase
VDEQVFISGQIGLIPSSLTLPSPRCLALESALCLQHVKRITDVLKENSGGWHGYTQLAMYWLTDGQNASHARKAHQAYEVVR